MPKKSDEQIRREHWDMRVRAQAVIGNATESEEARGAARWILDGDTTEEK